VSRKHVKADFVVIGAGVVGCAIARELAIKYPEKTIFVLEKAPHACSETSRYNSGVLHSGFHQNPKFLKSKLAERGSRLAVKYAEDKKLSILKCGMMIVLSKDSLLGTIEEIPSFLNLIKRGFSQDIKFKFLTPKGVKKLEPNILSLGGVFIPDVCVIDPIQFVNFLWQDARRKGVQFHFNHKVREIEFVNFANNDCIVSTSSTSIYASTVINAAGLYADEVASMAGFDDYKVFPWRGEYYEVSRNKRDLVGRLVYPVVSNRYPGKGIHFSPRVDGRLFIGPNARLVPSKNYYTQDKTPVKIFQDHIRHLCPDIHESDLKWAYSGIRPKLTDKPHESDFIISLDKREPQFVNLIGIESPGLSSSMAIAEYVVNLFKNPHTHK
jgi:glycerol-3-phosphate dehydrogenase